MNKTIVLAFVLALSSLFASAQSFTYQINGAGPCILQVVPQGGISCQNLRLTDGTSDVVGFTVNSNGSNGTFTTTDGSIYDVTWAATVVFDVHGKHKILFQSSPFNGGATTVQSVTPTTLKAYAVTDGTTTIPIANQPPAGR